MLVKGTDIARQITFGYLNSLGLTEVEAYLVKKGRQVDVNSVCAKVLIEKGLATAVKVEKERERVERFVAEGKAKGQAAAEAIKKPKVEKKSIEYKKEAE
ncbi:hypothetical protein LCGC14_1281700 [marine sediment metagenome]|uniref:Uncharacterized protein n=1 Tax=marine sediment metagenome TaxID=412755 RepID=A0A0F9NY23_9ZZZZ